MSAKNRHTVTIDKVITGGQGLAKLADGMLIMVPFVLPGERVVVAIEKKKKSFAEAILLEVLEASPQRVEPPCQHFTHCGGCHLQHGDYQSQLAIKEAILRDLLSRHREWPLGHLGAICQATLASPTPFHYRQRIRLQIDDSGRIGFFARRSHDVVEIDSCPLATKPLNHALRALRELTAFHKILPHSEALELLFSPLTGRVEVIVRMRRKPRAADQQAATALVKAVDLLQAVWLAGEGFVTEGPYVRTKEGDAASNIAFALPQDVGGKELTLRFEAGGFCQVNQEQNEHLTRQLLAWAEVAPEDTVLDLFCGMGNFSLPLALTARKVVGTDLQRSSIRGAQRNAVANHLPNCLFLRADAVQAVREFRSSREQFDLILLDPPRQGCHEILPLLADLGAKKIIYISCDPATLVRDLKRLHELGFLLSKIRSVDMFPQTCHVESIALLRRS